jgi:hypothetical protein
MSGIELCRSALSAEGKAPAADAQAAPAPRQQRRISGSFGAAESPVVQMSAESAAALAGDDDLLVPRLVARIAELEHQMYASDLQSKQSADGGLLDRFSSLLKRAQLGIDAAASYMCACPPAVAAC